MDPDLMLTKAAEIIAPDDAPDPTPLPEVTVGDVVLVWDSEVEAWHLGPVTESSARDFTVGGMDFLRAPGAPPVRGVPCGARRHPRAHPRP